MLQALIALLSKGQGGDPNSAVREGELPPMGGPASAALDPASVVRAGEGRPTEAGPRGPLMDPSSVAREGEMGPAGGGEVTMPPALLEIMRRLKLRPSV
jgi:hypothetical protein